MRREALLVIGSVVLAPALVVWTGWQVFYALPLVVLGVWSLIEARSHRRDGRV